MENKTSFNKNKAVDGYFKIIVDGSPMFKKILIRAVRKKEGLEELRKELNIALGNLLRHIKLMEKNHIAKRVRFGHGRKVYLEVNPEIKEILMPYIKMIEQVETNKDLSTLKEVILGNFDNSSLSSLMFNLLGDMDLFKVLVALELEGYVFSNFKLTRLGKEHYESLKKK